jgi:hypothetical protein
MNPNQEFYVITRDRDEHGGHMDGCIVWWRPEGKGYTYDLNQAGIFTAADMAKNYPSLDNCLYIPREVVDANPYSPRLAWWSRGRGATRGIFTALKEESRRSAVSAPATQPDQSLPDFAANLTILKLQRIAPDYTHQLLTVRDDSGVEHQIFVSTEES